MRQKISIVIPVFNEEKNLPVMHKALQRMQDGMPYAWEIIFVDDGSTDGTADVLRCLSSNYDDIFFLSFTRNFGHQAALRAGIKASTGDCVITMDGDMQHPPDVIPCLLGKWEEGYDVVYTIRRDHESISWSKKKTSSLFYKVMNSIADIELQEGEADFRLVTRRVAEVLNKLEEHEIFYRGMVKWLGFSQAGIDYDAAPRKHGTSKFTFRKMLRLAVHGITSFSVKPLHAVAVLGIVIAALSLLFMPYVLISYLSGHTVSGWASVMIAISFFGGLQLFVIGVIGVYLGKLFMQSKNRPHYVINEMSVYEPMRLVEF